MGKAQWAHVLWMSVSDRYSNPALGPGEGILGMCDGAVEEFHSRIISTHGLQFARLIRCYLLRRRALFVEDVVEGDADGDGVADVGGEVWAGDTEGDGGVVDGVDEVVHRWGGEVHESVYLFCSVSTLEYISGRKGKRCTCACEDEPVYCGNSGDEQPSMMPKYS